MDLRKTLISLILAVLLLAIAGQALAESLLDPESMAHEQGSTRFCYATKDGELNLKLQVQRTDVESVSLVLGDGQEMPMQFYVENSFYKYYVIQFKPGESTFTYRFKVKAGEEVAYYGPQGLGENSGEYRYTVQSVQTFATPEWAKGAVIYHIFPDRFNNGDLSNDPKPGEWSVYDNPVAVRQWDDLPVNPGRGADFFGGDLQGIIDKLDYLADLGVQAIYMNPIHASVSNHKYDASDYLKVDPHFGSNELFKRLVEEAKARGIYIIIDGVFNHTGADFWAFRDIREKGEKSPYVNWYNIYSFPVDPAVGNYKSWNNYTSLPVLNYSSPEVRQHILDVVRYWLSLGVKGIRLDAPKEVPHDFWKEMNKVVKEIDPEALIIGEVWDDAGAWINTGEFDSTMNYLYRDLMIKFFAQRTKRPGTFARELGIELTRYPEPASHVLYNMASTHDKERFITLTQGNVERVKPFVIFQFTFLGAPAIYYGEEVGLEGGADPDNRRPMIWDAAKQNQELQALYKKMIHIRRTYPALQRGSYRVVYTDDKAKILVFEREYQGQRVLSVINNNDQPAALQINFQEWGIADRVEDVLNGGEYSADHAELSLKANFGAVLVVKE